MKIKIERSGGLTGIISTNEIDANNLPSSLEGTIKELLNSAKFPLTRTLKKPKGAADYLNYRITIKEGKEEHIIECSEPEMDKGVKNLVNYVQKYDTSDKHVQQNV